MWQFQKVAINLPRSAGLWPLLVGAEKRPWTCQGRQVEESGHEPAKVGRFMATFSRGRKVAMNLPGSAGWEPEVHGGWKPAVNLPRSAGWDHRAENWPWTCQGRQVEDIPLIMDWVNGWKVAMNLPRSAGWGQKAHYGWKPAINLPRSAGWERGHQPAKVGRLSPQKKVWLNLPRSAGLWPLFQPANSGRCAQVYRGGIKVGGQAFKGGADSLSPVSPPFPPQG